MTLALASLGLPSSAGAAVTIGSDLSPGPTIGPGCNTEPCTVVSFTIPGQQTVSPLDGVVTRWRIRGPAGSGTLSLRVIRPLGGGVFTSGGRSATESVVGVPELWTFLTRVPIKAGDFIGLNLSPGGPGGLHRATTGATWSIFEPALSEGGSATPLGPFDDTELLMNADVEPDADCDGFGDETQDPSVSGGCLASPAATSAAKAALAGVAVKTNGKAVPIPLSCPAGGGNCDANQLTLQTASLVTLDTATTAAKKKRKPKRVLLGNASFSVPAGQTRTVIVPLTKGGRKLFKLRRKVAASAVIMGGGTSSIAALQIKRKGKKKRGK